MTVWAVHHETQRSFLHYLRYSTNGFSPAIAVYKYSKYSLEETVKEHRQWLLAVLNSINEEVATSDPSSLIKFMNPVAKALTDTIPPPPASPLLFLPPAETSD